MMARLEPWSYDIWAYGCLIFEIMSGFPLWLSLKGKIVNRHGKVVLDTGAFAVAARVNKKIVAKQLAVVKNLSQTIKKHDCFPVDG